MWIPLASGELVPTQEPDPLFFSDLLSPGAQHGHQGHLRCPPHADAVPSLAAQGSHPSRTRPADAQTVKDPGESIPNPVHSCVHHQSVPLQGHDTASGNIWSYPVLNRHVRNVSPGGCEGVRPWGYGPVLEERTGAQPVLSLLVCWGPRLLPGRRAH